jgi:hypothetical protein
VIRRTCSTHYGVGITMGVSSTPGFHHGVIVFEALQASVAKKHITWIKNSIVSAND